MPSRTEGMPSMMNSHCQPFSPMAPSSPSRSPEIGAPISGLLLGLDGAMGLKGWQWLFIIEGIPSVLLGIVTWFYLTDRPAKADWLTAEQKAWLSSRLESEIAAKQAAQHLTLRQALASPKVITLSLIYFGFVAALYGSQNCM